MCVPPLSSPRLDIHPLVALSNDKEFRPLRRATNAPRVGSAVAFEKARAKLSKRLATESPTNQNFKNNSRDYASYPMDLR